MPLNDDQRLALMTNVARDRAEQLASDVCEWVQNLRIAADHEPTAAASETDRLLTEVLDASRRVVFHLSAALAVAQEGLTHDAA